jgi:hypothetical protein
MTDESREISILDARLAEIDRRLSSIQTGLAADLEDEQVAESPSPASPAAPEPPPPPDPLPLALAPPPEPPPRREPPPRSEPPPRPGPLPRPDPPRVETQPVTTPAALVEELHRLATAHERVLRSTRELLEACERILSRLAPASPAPAVREFSVSAGPFADKQALRGFEQTLAQIPEVREVAIRGYEGDDRAIVDVQLFGPEA